MDRLDAMTALIAAVDGGSLSAASRTLGMPLATVSRKVSDLEAHLRTRLLVRTSRRLVLTQAGEGYVAACRRILEQIDEAERTAAGEYRTPRGTLTITAPIVFGRLHLEPVVLDFLKAYPDIAVRLVLADQVVNLTDEHVNVALRIGVLPDSDLLAMRLGAIGWVTCASPAYLAARGTPQTPDDLPAHDCITFAGRYSSNAWAFAAEGFTRSVIVNARFVVNTAEAAIDAALASAGITHVLSYQAARRRKGQFPTADPARVRASAPAGQPAVPRPTPNPVEAAGLPGLRRAPPARLARRAATGDGERAVLTREATQRRRHPLRQACRPLRDGRIERSLAGQRFQATCRTGTRSAGPLRRTSTVPGACVARGGAGSVTSAGAGVLWFPQVPDVLDCTAGAAPPL